MGDTLEPKKLLLQSNGAVTLQPGERNATRQQFVTGQGELVARFNNFTREKKFFTFLIEETDADGNPLHRTVEEEGKGKKLNSKKILAAVDDIESDLTVLSDGAEIPAFKESISAKLLQLKELLSK